MKGIRPGTHTSSIAASNYVQVADVAGHWSLVNVAVGILPLAHLAIYKAVGVASRVAYWLPLMLLLRMA